MIELFPTILVTPDRGWRSAREITSKRSVLLKYVLPLTLAVAACAFIATYYLSGDMMWKASLKHCVVTALTLFMSLYIATFCIRLAHKYILKIEASFSTIFIFTTMAFSCVYAVAMLDELFEDVFFIPVFYLYTLYLVFTGYSSYLKYDGIKSDKKIAFITVASFLIILLPAIVEKVILHAIPGMN